MSKQQEIKGRISHKHGTEADWLAAGIAENPFIPYPAELIIYDPDTDHPKSRFKFGDGTTAVHLLPFYEGKDLTVLADYKYPLTWNGSMTGLTTVSIDENSLFCKVSNTSCRHNLKLTEGKTGTNSFGVDSNATYFSTISGDASFYSIDGNVVVVATLKDGVVFNDLYFPVKGTYFKIFENENGKVWISNALQEVIEYNYEDFPNILFEVANNKVNVIGDSATEDQYPTVTAIKKYVDDSIPEIPDVSVFEKHSNKAVTIDESANDTSYPTTKAVKNYVENAVVLPDMTGYEKISNKVSNLKTNVTADQYPTAQAVKNYIAENVIIPDMTGYEINSNKVTSITSTSTDAQYPSAKAVKSYVDRSIPDVSGFESASNKVNVLNESATQTQYPSAKAVKDYIDENTISKLPDLTGYEEKSNKITNITSGATDTQYPSAKAVKSYVDNNIPDVSGFEKTENKVEIINDLSTHDNYPTAQAVREYIKDSVSTSNAFQKNILIDYISFLLWDGRTEGLVSLANLYYGSSFYKVSDNPIIGAITNVTMFEEPGETPYDINIDANSIYLPDRTNPFVYAYNCGYSEPLIISVLKDNAIYNGHIFPQRGTYFVLKDYPDPYGKIWMRSIKILQTNYDHQEFPATELEVTSNRTSEINEGSTDNQYPTAKAVKNYVATQLVDISHEALAGKFFGRHELIPYQELTFETLPDMGIGTQTYSINCPLIPNKIYKIKFDGKDYDCISQSTDGS